MTIASCDSKIPGDKREINLNTRGCSKQLRRFTATTIFLLMSVPILEMSSWFLTARHNQHGWNLVTCSDIISYKSRWDTATRTNLPNIIKYAEHRQTPQIITNQQTRMAESLVFPCPAYLERPHPHHPRRRVGHHLHLRHLKRRSGNATSRKSILISVTLLENLSRSSRRSCALCWALKLEVVPCANPNFLCPRLSAQHPGLAPVWHFVSVDIPKQN